MNNKSKVILQSALLILVPIAVIFSMNYILVAMGKFNMDQMLKTTMYMGIISSVSGIFFMMNKWGKPIISHILVLLLSLLFAFWKTSNLGKTELGFFPLFILYFTHLAVLDLTMFVSYTKFTILKVRSLVYIIGGFTAYTLSMLFSFLIGGTTVTPVLLKRWFNEGLNIYILVGLGVAVGVLIYDKLNEGNVTIES